MRKLISLVVVIWFAAIIGCGTSSPPIAAKKSITLAAGTTLKDSGLFDELLPRCKMETGIEVKAIAVGTGQALEIAKRGDADALLTHSPAAEKEFLEAGWAESRNELFWNDFVILGPAADPAGVKQAENATAALAKIEGAKASFVSRGDDSGNHKLEMTLWKELAIEPKGTWYMSVGAGMAHATRLASEKQAYLLADRGTWLAMRKEVELAIMHEGDPKLVNQYAVLVVNPEKHPHTHIAEAREFAAWLQRPETQEFVAGFGKDKYGEPLFKIGLAK
jgi:tungstate transport system substrate-binding protein